MPAQLFIVRYDSREFKKAADLGRGWHRGSYATDAEVDFGNKVRLQVQAVKLMQL